MLPDARQFCDWSTWAYRVAADDYRSAVARGRTVTLGRVTGLRTELGATVAELNRQTIERCRYVQVRPPIASDCDERPSATSRDITAAVTPTRGAPPRPALSLGPPNGRGDPTKCESAGVRSSDALIPFSIRLTRREPSRGHVDVSLCTARQRGNR